LIAFLRSQDALPGDPSLPGYGRILLEDTENESSLKYAMADENDVRPDAFDFDVEVFPPPYTPEEYVIRLGRGIAAGYAVVILDQITNEWEGKGGVLQRHAEITRNSASKNSYIAWQQSTPSHQSLFEAINAAPLHVICTMRAKVKHIITAQKEIVKVGVKPIQRDTTEYEFDIAGMMGIDRATRTNHITFEGTRCPDVSNSRFDNPGEDLGRVIGEWLLFGRSNGYAGKTKLDQAAVTAIADLFQKVGATEDEIRHALAERGVHRVDELSPRAAADLEANLGAAVKQNEMEARRAEKQAREEAERATRDTGTRPAEQPKKGGAAGTAAPDQAEAAARARLVAEFRDLLLTCHELHIDPGYEWTAELVHRLETEIPLDSIRGAVDDVRQLIRDATTQKEEAPDAERAEAMGAFLALRQKLGETGYVLAPWTADDEQWLFEAAVGEIRNETVALRVLVEKRQAEAQAYREKVVAEAQASSPPLGGPQSDDDVTFVPSGIDRPRPDSWVKEQARKKKKSDARPEVLAPAEQGAQMEAMLRQNGDEWNLATTEGLEAALEAATTLADEIGYTPAWWNKHLKARGGNPRVKDAFIRMGRENILGMISDLRSIKADKDGNPREFDLNNWAFE
jgi:hypothetical protein